MLEITQVRGTRTVTGTLAVHEYAPVETETLDYVSTDEENLQTQHSVVVVCQCVFYLTCSVLSKRLKESSARYNMHDNNIA